MKYKYSRKKIANILRKYLWMTCDITLRKKIIKNLLAKQEDKKGCKHDWSYDEPMYSTKRVCTKCGRTEFRQIYQVNGIENATNWNQCIQEVKQPIKSKDVKFEEIIELKSLRYQDSDAIKMFIKINELVRNQNKLIQEVNMLKAGK